MEKGLETKNLKKLRKQFWLWLFAAMGGTAFYIRWLFFRIDDSKLIQPSIFMVVLFGLFFKILWGDLGLNRIITTGQLLPGLGLANHITIFRGLLLIPLAGFLFIPVESDWNGWLPGILFLTISLLDLADGAAARLGGVSTGLGERLDMRLDGIGVLLASIIMVTQGKAPLIFILAGLARFLYIFGQWVLRKMERQVYLLPPNPYRRALAGTMMGFISVALFPIFSPQVTRIVSVLFLIPFLIGFTQDWFYTSGVLHAEFGIKLPRARWFEGLLFVLRVAGGIILHAAVGFPQNLVEVIGLLFCILLIPGILPRVSAVGVLISAGYLLSMGVTNPALLAVLFFSTSAFFLGGGRFSIWSPEEWLIFHRVGDEGTP